MNTYTIYELGYSGSEDKHGFKAASDMEALLAAVSWAQGHGFKGWELVREGAHTPVALVSRS